MPQEISKLYKDNTLYSDYDYYLTRILNNLNCHLPENEEESITDWHNKTKEWLVNKVLPPVIDFIYKYLELTKGEGEIYNTKELEAANKNWSIIVPENCNYLLDTNQITTLAIYFYNIIDCYNKKELKDNLLFKYKYEKFKKEYKKLEKMMSVINEYFSFFTTLRKKEEVKMLITSVVNFYNTPSNDLDVKTQLKPAQNVLVTKNNDELNDESWAEINIKDIKDATSEQKIKPPSIFQKIKNTFKL